MDTAKVGVKMLVEKSITHTIEDAERMIKTAEENEIKLMVWHIERFNAVITGIKKVIEKTKVSLIEITQIGPFLPRIKDFGVVIDVVIYGIDLINYLTGSEYVRNHSLTSRYPSQHKEVAILFFQWANGILAWETVSLLTPLKVREIAVTTGEKFIKASLIDLTLFEYSKFDENYTYLLKEVYLPFCEPLKLELTAFINSIKNYTPTLVIVEDGLRALELAAICLSKEPRGES